MTETCAPELVINQWDLGGESHWGRLLYYYYGKIRHQSFSIRFKETVFKMKNCSRQKLFISVKKSTVIMESVVITKKYSQI